MWRLCASFLEKIIFSYQIYSDLIEYTGKQSLSLYAKEGFALINAMCFLYIQKDSQVMAGIYIFVNVNLQIQCLPQIQNCSETVFYYVIFGKLSLLRNFSCCPSVLVSVQASRISTPTQLPIESKLIIGTNSFEAVK